MMLTAAVFFVVELVALTYGIKIVLPEIVSATYTGFVITPVLVPIFEITGHVLSAYYMFLVSAIIASATWMALSSARRFKAELTMTAPTRDHSGFFDIAGFFFATLFFDYALYFLMVVFGSEPTSPIEDEETWALLFGLANASVWEEIVSRTLLIGAPMVFVDMARRKLQIKKISYVVGGGFQLGIPEASLVVFSSLMFGFAHFAGGWEAWKIVPTSLGGVMFGYLFLRYGLYASIMLHFGINYMLAPTEITGSESVLVGTGIMILIWMGIGAVMFFYYLTRIAEFVTGKRYFEPRPAYVSVYASAYGHQTQVPQTAAPSAYQYQTMGQTPIPQEPRRGGFYVCPVCGGTEAKWISGKFQCLRCGNLS
jgi:membrane protease YdiL (CAAX protease family)